MKARTKNERPAYLSSAFQDWRTPPDFLDLVREVGPIALDPASAPDNPTGAARWLWQHRDHCGLRDPWTRDGLAFINPRYGRFLPGPVDPFYVHRSQDKGVVGVGRGWARKIAQDPGPWIALLPSRTGSSWFVEVAAAADVRCDHKGRIAFVDATGKPVKGNTVDSAVLYRGPDPDRFADVFRERGDLWVRRP